MQFEHNEEQAMIRESVAAFARDRVREQAMRHNEHGGTFEPEIRALGELGLLGVLVPESLGGVDLGASELVIALRELAMADAGLAAVVAQHNAAAIGWLLTAKDDHRERIEELASGAKLACCGHVTGPTIGGMYADVLVVGGVEVTVRELNDADRTPFDMLGLRTAGAARLAFSDDPPNTLSPSADLTTTAAYKRVNGLVRLATAAIALGIGQRALEEGVGYSLERVQFGKPIARFQALQWMTADAATDLTAAELLLNKAAWLYDQGRAFEDAAARCHHLCVRVARAAADRALQMHGGYGYTEDFPVERLYRDAYSLHALTGRTDAARIDVAMALASATAPR